MKVSEIVKARMQAGKPSVSVEIIPPRNGALISGILKKTEALVPLKPDFISITRGAGGSLRGGTVPIAYLIKERLGIETAAHLTCIDTSVEELENSLMDHLYLGIENILALRGDPPRDAPPEYRENRGFRRHRYANDLVKQIARMNKGLYLKRKADNSIDGALSEDEFRRGESSDFCILVAGHPEGHPECPDRRETIGHLKEKADSGAELILTQMIFIPSIYSRFLDETKNAGISVPIIPGVRPITKFSQIEHVEGFFGVTVGDRFKRELEGLDEKECRARGISLTIELCRDLLNRGAPGIHLYLMNDIQAGKKIIEALER